ncbi:hypothetical protein KR044_012997 [Drosophila immigrans]|nr:hypothetical protein KR044_012997 [Drosophila immigrans]
MEAGREKEKEFIESAYELVKQYEFDGLDLAYQFPRTMPQNISQRWVQFNDLVLNLSKRFRPNGLLLTLTVLPRVNSKWYIHAVGIESNLDFVNVAAFDFVTPTQSPQQADYTAPLYHDPSQYRDPFYNVDMQVRSWVSRPFRPLNLNLGIGMYGNAWATTYFSGSTGEPIVQITDGPAKGYPFTREGTVSYPQICHLLRNSNVKKDYQSGLAGERAASFAYRPSVGSYHKGYWVTYDNLLALAKKAKYARKHVGGVAIFDLGYDDYEGYCTEEKFLFFNHIRSYFLQPEQPDPTIELHEFPLPEP